MTEHAPTGPHYYDDGIWRPYDEALTKLAAAEAEVATLREAAKDYMALVARWFDFSGDDAHDALVAALATPTATAREAGEG